MKKVTDIYSEKALPETQISTGIRSDHARRAIILFPTEEDKEKVLGLDTIEQ